MTLQEFLGEGLGAFELRRGLVRPEAAQSRGHEGVDHAGNQRRLGTDDGEPDVFGLGERHQPGDVLGRDVDIAHARFGGRAAVAGRDQHFGDLGRLRAFPGQRVFATAAAYDQDLHGFLAVSDGSGACR